MKKGEARTNTNAQLIREINEILITEKSKKEFQTTTQRIEERAIKLLGKAIRKAKTEPEAEALMHETEDTWNIPMPKTGLMRNGKPRINWAIETANKAWWKHKMYEDTNIRAGSANRGQPRDFNYRYITHVRKIIKEARNGTF